MLPLSHPRLKLPSESQTVNSPQPVLSTHSEVDFQSIQASSYGQSIGQLRTLTGDWTWAILENYPPLDVCPCHLEVNGRLPLNMEFHWELSKHMIAVLHIFVCLGLFLESEPERGSFISAQMRHVISGRTSDPQKPS